MLVSKSICLGMQNLLGYYLDYLPWQKTPILPVENLCKIFACLWALRFIAIAISCNTLKRTHSHLLSLVLLLETTQQPPPRNFQKKNRNKSGFFLLHINSSFT